MKLNKILESYADKFSGQPMTVRPSYSGEDAFLNSIVRPIYKIIQAEVEISKNETAPYSAWRNYDDLNDYFWSKICFEELKLPINVRGNFFASSSRQKDVRKILELVTVMRHSSYKKC